jgi:hypothetical protein
MPVGLCQGKLMEIFRPKTGSKIGRRKLNNEELHNLYSPPSIIRLIKSRKLIWAGHVERMKREMHTKVLAEKCEGRSHLGDGVNKRKILKWILNKTGSEHVDWIQLVQYRVQ